MTKKFKQNARLTSFIDSRVAQSVMKRGTYRSDNINLIDRYNRELYGDEEDGLSQIVTPEVQDTVDDYHASLVRSLVRAGPCVEFAPVNASPDAIQESKDKNIFIAYLTQTIKDYYKVNSDYLKEMLIQKFPLVEYGIEEIERPITRRFTGLSSQDVANITAQMEEEYSEAKTIKIETEIDVEEGAVFDQEFEIKATIVTEESNFFIQNVPWEDAIIPNDIQSIEDADCFGKEFTVRRGDLVGEGFSVAEVRKIPQSDHYNREAKIDRYQDYSNDQLSQSHEWANEEVVGQDVCVLFDENEDGILKRYRVTRFHEYIKHFEEFDHVPYAGNSAIQMPHTLIGKSIAEKAEYHQRVSTVLNRNMMNNIVAVNAGRHILNDSVVNMDDVLNVQVNGIIRTKDVSQVVPEVVLYHGDKILQIQQYQDSKHAQSTGQMLSNQALSSDQLNQETATRFEGIEKAAKSKVEQVAADTMELFYKRLFEGLIWFAQHYQNSEMEVYLFGRQMKINPASWKYGSRCIAKTGTGFGDDQAALQTLGGILATQKQEIEAGSGLSDYSKVYNTYLEMARRAGISDPSSYYNDPSQPDQLLQAENELLKAQLQMMQMQSQNPLAEAEKVKQETEVLKAELKSQETLRSDQLKAAELQAKQQLELAKLNQNQQQFAAAHRQRQDEFDTSTALDITNMELDHSTDLPGGLDG